MSHIFTYPGVYWIARVMAMVVMLGGTWLIILVLARFFRPKHVVALVRADPPNVEEVGGEFGGLKARVRFNAQASALKVLEHRIIQVEGAVGQLFAITGELNRRMDDPETGAES
jgi:hypothetical protein